MCSCLHLRETGFYMQMEHVLFSIVLICACSATFEWISGKIKVKISWFPWTLQCLLNFRYKRAQLHNPQLAWSWRVLGSLHMFRHSQALSKTEPQCLETWALSFGGTERLHDLEISRHLGSVNTSSSSAQEISRARWRRMMDEDRLQNMNSGHKVACCCLALSGLSVMDISISFCVTRVFECFALTYRRASLLNKSPRSPSCLAVRLWGFLFGEMCYEEIKSENSATLITIFSSVPSISEEIVPERSGERL